jgi:choline dehydrogenase-like flavoprotein
MAEFCRRTVSTIWHYHGGCVVGKVVDRDYHLIGVGALRVVDGSTLTVSPGTNPQATLMMLGRSLFDFIIVLSSYLRMFVNKSLLFWFILTDILG